MKFRKYQKVRRLGHRETEGILNGIVTVMPKMDGTNASIWMENGELKAGSRNRELIEGDDNRGFRNWVVNNEALKELFKGSPDRTFYGEWLVPHTLKTYGADSWSKFYLFDIVCEFGGYFDPSRIPAETLEGTGVEVLPVTRLENPTIEQLQELMASNTYRVTEGVGEGIVIKNYDWIGGGQDRCWAKMINEEFATKMGTKVKKLPQDYDFEKGLVEEFLSTHFIDKEYAKLAIDGWDQSMIPKLLGVVWHEFIAEELWAILKKYKNPKINFKALQAEVFKKVKATRQDIF